MNERTGLVWKRMRDHPAAVVALAVVVVMALACVAAPLIVAYEFDAIDLSGIRQPPSSAHWMGTDDLGRDLFTRMLYGGRVSILIGVLAALIGTSIGSLVGALAGFYGGRIDGVLMRLTDVAYSIPALPLLIVLSAYSRAGAISVAVIVGLLSWMATARVVRAEVLSIKQRDYVEAARGLGSRNRRLITGHILPNAVGPIVVGATLAVGNAIILESSLSFLGLGVQPPTPTWGNMLQEAQVTMATRPWLTVFPGLAILTVVLSVNFIGDGLQEAFDPTGERFHRRWRRRRRQPGRRGGSLPRPPAATPATATAAASSHLLEVRGLTTTFETDLGPITAVDGVSYTLDAGEALAIVGESGSGKTVAALSLIGLVPPPGSVEHGEVILEGRNLLGLSGPRWQEVRGRKIAMIFQDPMTSLNPVLSIGSQITESLTWYEGLSTDAARSRAIELLELVQIPHPAERLADYPHQLSGGQRQRVMIAMALSCSPSVLIADEPTTALDVTIQAQIVDLVQDLRQQLGLAIIWITHDLAVVAGLVDRVAVMYAGHMVEQAPVGEIFRRPRHPYTLGLLRSMPSALASRGKRLVAIPGHPPDPSRPVVGCPFAPRCAYVVDRCQQENPPLLLAPPDHASACWQADEVAAATASRRQP